MEKNYLLPSPTPETAVNGILNALSTNGANIGDTSNMRSLILSAAHISYPDGFTEHRRLTPKARDAIVAAIEQRRNEFNDQAAAIIDMLKGLDLYTASMD